MRIISGQWRGTQLADLEAGDAGSHLRPTTDRMRETVFNMLASTRFEGAIKNKRVLDLFAGTGALGLEALSRGAQCVHFVDNGAVARGLLRKNIETLGAHNATSVEAIDVVKLKPNNNEPYGLVFLDPPYGKGLGERAIAHVLENNYLEAAAVIVWEDGVAPKLPPFLRLQDQRKIGNAYLTIASKVQS